MKQLIDSINLTKLVSKSEVLSMLERNPDLDFPINTNEFTNFPSIQGVERILMLNDKLDKIKEQKQNISVIEAADNLKRIGDTYKATSIELEILKQRLAEIDLSKFAIFDIMNDMEDITDKPFVDVIVSSALKSRATNPMLIENLINLVKADTTDSNTLTPFMGKSFREVLMMLREDGYTDILKQHFKEVSNKVFTLGANITELDEPIFNQKSNLMLDILKQII